MQLPVIPVKPEFPMLIGCGHLVLPQSGNLRRPGSRTILHPDEPRPEIMKFGGLCMKTCI